jgi:hypothetical protein
MDPFHDRLPERTDGEFGILAYLETANQCALATSNL